MYHMVFHDNFGVQCVQNPFTYTKPSNLSIEISHSHTHTLYLDLFVYVYILRSRLVRVPLGMASCNRYEYRIEIPRLDILHIYKYIDTLRIYYYIIIIYH